jgi:putative hydrolase of the HAD superfamily
VGGIRVALFDLDDTLFAHREAVERGIAAHRATLGGSIAEADAAAESLRWHELEELHYHRYLAGELDFVGQRRARARSFVEPYGVVLSNDADAEAWFDAYAVHYKNSWALHDDALPCLDALTAEPDPVRIGVITNGSLEAQTEKMRATGLLPRIEQVIASGSVGATKPDAAIFTHACSVFGVQPAEAAYIGDRLATDALGASAAGLLGVWLDRSGSATDDQLAAARAGGVPVIRSLAEVPRLLGH